MPPEPIKQDETTRPQEPAALPPEQSAQKEPANPAPNHLPPSQPVATHSPATPTSKAADDSKLSRWKEVREWSAIGISAVALIMSIIGYNTSRTATDLAQKQFDADRAVIVVGEKEDKDGTEGTMFKFHPLSPNQRLSVVELTFPSVIEKGPRRAVGPQQEISFLQDKFTAGDYYLKKAGPLKPGTFGFMESQIPVVIDAFYSVAGVSAQRRGLYYLTVDVSLQENATRADVSFEDFAFMQELNLDSDAQKVVDDLFALKKFERHDPKASATKDH